MLINLNAQSKSRRDKIIERIFLLKIPQYFLTKDFKEFRKCSWNSKIKIKTVENDFVINLNKF